MSDHAFANGAEQPGALIGRYKLLEQIGEGGMGTIWLAEQREPVKRRVALKIIKLGMDTKQVVARFDAERQALALMDHPHIAKVFDAGATDAGRPYFVMEYIKGVPIVEYCDTERLDTKARLKLFTHVCQAIQHAHQKGVIHRDIKPSNVLVTLQDGAPVPKVIDFGIAKATTGDLTSKTLFTGHQQMIGTPAYMSPEQAEASGLDIDTRSDIYSLGVLLYELLTGSTPFDAETLRSRGHAEMMRVIREDEPHKPSTRISSLGDTGTRTAERRKSDVRRLSTLLRGDVDWIVMKCLEKDRTRRYDTATGLAADIVRHLNDEPVMAAAPGASYRLRKFVKRHRARVTVAAVAVIALVLGVVGTTAGMLRALDETHRADGEATTAMLAAEAETRSKTAAVDSAAKAVAAAKRAEAAAKEEAQARQRAETISAFVTTALRAGDAENEGGGQDTTILAAMGNAIADIDSGRFSDDPETEAGLKGTIGVILLNNGRLQQAEPLATTALETLRRLHEGDDPAVAGALNNLARLRLELGRPAEAEPLHVEALAMLQRHCRGDERSVAACLGNVATVRLALGRAAEAEPLFVESLEMFQRLYPGDHQEVAGCLNNLAVVWEALGRRAEAVPLYIRALEMKQRLFKGDHPVVAEGLGNLALVWQELGRMEEAARRTAEALAMWRRLYQGDHPGLALGLNNVAHMLLASGRPAEAEPLLTEAIDMLRRLFKGDHPTLATCLDNLGKVRQALGRLAEAEPSHVEAVEMLQRLYKDDHPDVVLVKSNLAFLYRSQRRLDKSIPLYEAVLKATEARHGRLHRDTILAVANLGVSYYEAGRPADAIPLLDEAYQATKRDVSLSWIGARLLEARAQAANPARPADTAQALTLLRELLADARATLSQNSPQLAARVVQCASALLALKGWDEADPLFREALMLDAKVLGSDSPDVLKLKTDLAFLCWRAGRFDQSIRLYEAIVPAEQVTLGRQHVETLTNVANLGVNYRDAGRLAEAIPLLEEVHTAARREESLKFYNPELLEAYVRAAALAQPADPSKFRALVQEVVADARAALPKDGPELATQLAQASRAWFSLQAWTEAEALLRECLTLRERAQPDVWTTFSTRGLLGAALLGQGKYAEAGPLLLAGYRGMKEREATIPQAGKARVTEAILRIVQLYDATGNAAEAAVWRDKLATAATESRTATRPGG